MAPETPSRPSLSRWVPVLLAVLVPALLVWLFWRTTPPVGGYAQRPGGGEGAKPSSYAASALEPAALYAQNCASCHGPDLRGTPAGTALKRPNWPYGQNGELLVRIIYEGRGLRMPSFGGRLSRQQITALSAWLQEANASGAAR